ncbi:MAG: dual specificity protein phosphatase family protein [Planctomycetota bacterium]|nr:dual specificity protein phosphatase family protein [Planctomycetota bacterium]
MDGPQWDSITEHILIGTSPNDKEALWQLKSQSECTAILSLQSDDELDRHNIDWFDLQGYAEGLGMVMNRIPMNDFDLGNQQKVLGEAVHGLASLLSKNHKVYVYCNDGINRSPLVVLGYLTYCLGRSLEDANLVLVTKRPHASPPIEVWRATRIDLLKPKADLIARLSNSESENPLSENDAETRVLQSIFLPKARENYGF